MKIAFLDKLAADLGDAEEAKILIVVICICVILYCVSKVKASNNYHVRKFFVTVWYTAAIMCVVSISYYDHEPVDAFGLVLLGIMGAFVVYTWLCDPGKKKGAR